MQGVRYRRLVAALGGMLAALAGASPALAAAPQSLLHPAGPQAEELAKAITWDILAITVIFVPVALLALYILARFRRRPGDDELPPQVDGNPRWELGWTLALIVGLVIMVLHPLPAEAFFERLPKGEKTLTVEVIGHQWWWEIRYPDYGIVTANEMHIPAGTPVIVKTWSADVIHSFGVPRLGGKNDALPGRVLKFWLEADEPGVYQGQCYELCGASHARMLARVIAHKPEEFDAWVQARQNPVVAVPEGSLAAQGEQVFRGLCAACHTVDGTPAKGTIGPNLTAFGTRTSIGGGVLENTPENLAVWLADPPAVKPGSIMPNLGLSQDNIQALVAYLQALK